MSEPQVETAAGPRVVIADDQDLVRSGLEMVLTARGIDVVGLAADGREAIGLARELRPDVVLMDIRMPVMDGIAATKALQQLPSPPRVLVLTTYDLDTYVYDAFRAGASGFLLKDIDPPDLLSAVRVVAAGEALLAPRLTRRLIEAFVAQERAAPGPRPDDAIAELTPREREVLTLVGRGLSNSEIADELVLSPLTAKTHVARLFQKLDARDRAQLVVLAYETGLVVPGDRT